MISYSTFCELPRAQRLVKIEFIYLIVILDHCLSHGVCEHRISQRGVIKIARRILIFNVKYLESINKSGLCLP